MPKNSAVLLTIIFTSFVCATSYLSASSNPVADTSVYPVADTPVYVAHAGGAVNGAGYLNTFEALDFNYAKGFRYFELDFSWTSDGALAGIHDWGQTYKRLFVNSQAVPDLEGFKRQQMKDGSTAITFDRLVDWLSAHPDAWIVTDIKEDNLAALKWVKSNYPTAIERLIPQIYETEQYDEVEKLGFRNIILTMYRLPDSANQRVLSFAQLNPLLALTLPAYRFEQQSLADGLLKLNVPVCVHTINDLQTWQSLRNEGAKCIYTDGLIGDR